MNGNQSSFCVTLVVSVQASGDDTGYKTLTMQSELLRANLRVRFIVKLSQSQTQIVIVKQIENLEPCCWRGVETNCPTNLLEQFVSLFVSHFLGIREPLRAQPRELFANKLKFPNSRQVKTRRQPKLRCAPELVS